MPAVGRRDPGGEPDLFVPLEADLGALHEGDLGEGLGPAGGTGDDGACRHVAIGRGEGRRIEEVVTLRVATVDGERADLRLWIVDRDGAAWATMRGAKAERHGLGEARAELLRGGSFECVVVRRVEDREAVVATHEQRQQKYRVQRLATALGVMPREPSDEMVAVRIEPCPG